MFFQVNVTPKSNQPQNVPELPELAPVLVLAPFQAQPRVKLDALVNTTVQASLAIKNTGDKALKVKASRLPPEDRFVILEPLELTVGANSEENVTFSWTPKESGSWNDKVQFSVGGHRLKYDVCLLTSAKTPKKVASKGNLRSFGRTLDAVQQNVVKKKLIIKQQVLTTTTTITYEENKENLARSNKGAKVYSQETTVERNISTLNLTDIQLTPVKNPSCPQILISECQNGDEKIGDAEFYPGDEVRLSPVDEFDGQIQRRGTYIIKPIANARQTGTIVEEDENYDDSLSPVANKNDQMDFSAMLNDLATLDTPISKELPAACSTQYKDDPKMKVSRENSVLRSSTFSIDDSNTSKSNGTYEIVEETSDKHLKPSNLMNKFNKINGNEMLGSSVRALDNSSVREILEADLWAKGESVHPNRSTAASNASVWSVESSKVIDKTPHCERVPQKAEAFCIPLSVPQGSSSKSVSIGKRISPFKKNSLLSTAKHSIQHKLIQKKTATKPSSSLTKRKSEVSIPKTRVAKLSLAALNCSNLNASVVSKKSDSSFKFINLLEKSCNLDAYAITMAEDPFLSLHYDLEWIHRQQKEFTNWLNALFTPPEHLDADDAVKIDVGKLWQSCRAKDNIALAESKDTVSARYHTEQRLNTLRKAAYALYHKREVVDVLSKVNGPIEKETLVIRNDRDVHRDIGLQKEILHLLLSYNPLWLRIALEVVYNMKLQLQSNNDLVGITKFIINHFFSDPYLVQMYSYNNVISLKHPVFTQHLNKHILKKFLSIVYFLDQAKKSKLIGHDPCLFNKNSEFKKSRDILIVFARLVLSGVGDITRILKHYGYVVSHEQSYIEEFNYAVSDITLDLRDGVRLCRVMELIVGLKNLTSLCRVPAISRLQKIHNVDVALNALVKAGYTISGGIDGKTIAEGHREKTLSLIWQIIYKFQAPRYKKASSTIQNWWRKKVLYIRLKRFLSGRKTDAACVIQRSWKCYKARKQLDILRSERKVYVEKCRKSALVIQAWWRNHKRMIEDRQNFEQKRNAAIKIQKCFRRKLSTRAYVAERLSKLDSVKTLQCKWRATLLMRRDRNDFLKMKQAVIVIQRRWIAICKARAACRDYQQFKSAAINIQRRWRAQKLMKIDRKKYLIMKKAVVVIQSRWRSSIITRRVRNDFILMRHSVNVISNWWISVKMMREERQRYLNMRVKIIKNIVMIQRSWRRFRDTRDDVKHLKSCFNAAVRIQTWWRSLKIGQAVKSEYSSLKNATVVLQTNWRMIQTRKSFLKKKKAVLKIQEFYRKNRDAKAARNEFVAKRNAVICIQRYFRNLKLAEQVRENYLKTRRAVIIIQTRRRALISGRKQRNEFIAKRNAATCIQRSFRSLKLTKQVQQNYLETRKAVIVIQTRWRAVVAGRKQRSEFVSKKNAAITIQNHFRSFKLTKEVRKNYLENKNAAIIIQTRWRAVIAGKKQRNEYERLRGASIIIQKNWRAVIEGSKQRSEFMAKKNAAITIQRHFRNFKITNEIKKNYLKSKNAAIIIQTRWRAIIIGRKQRKEYERLQAASIIIQKNWRASKTAKEFNLQKSKVIIIQRWWRNLKISRAVKSEYSSLKNAAVVFQNNWRMIKARKTYLKKKEAVLKIQEFYRKNRDAKAARKEFVAKRNAIICVQRYFKNQKLAKQERENYLETRKAIIVIQTRWRALILGRRHRNKFIAIRNSATCIQRHFRNLKLTKQVQQNYLKYKKAVTVIQIRWRSRRLAKQIRGDYLVLKKCVVTIQVRWRANITGRNQRMNYEKLRSSCIIIQKNWRGFKAVQEFKQIKAATRVVQTRWRSEMLMREIRSKFIQQKRAAVIIQSIWRSYKARKELSMLKHDSVKEQAAVKIQEFWRGFVARKKYLELKRAAISIQRIYRSLRRVREDRRTFLNIRMKVVIIQRWWRRVQFLRVVKEQKRHLNAAMIIQSTWRGYKVRKLQSIELELIRQRSLKAARNADRTNTVANRLQEAVVLFQSIKNVGQLCVCLDVIDRLTKLSPKGCITFCQIGYYQALYNLMDQANRSIPWIDVCIKCTNILITFAKLPQTVSLIREVEQTENIARLMTVAIKHSKPMFLSCATFFWLLLLDDQFLENVKMHQKTIWLMKNLFSMTEKQVDKRQANQLLPSVRYDWGFTNRPKYFVNVSHAIVTLKNRLNM